MSIPFDKLDEHTYAIYLEVPGPAIVLLQGIFELYEGLGIVRTLSVQHSLVCILTVPDMYEDCARVLNAIQNIVPWKTAPVPEKEIRELYHGYNRKGKDL